MKALLVFIGAMVVTGIVWAANEVTVSTFLKVKNGSYEVQRNVSNYQDNQLTNLVSQGVAVCTPAAKAIPMGDVVDPKWVYLRNVSTNGYIDVTLTVRLYTNDMAVLPVASTNIQATAQATITNKLEYWVNQK